MLFLFPRMGVSCCCRFLVCWSRCFRFLVWGSHRRCCCVLVWVSLLFPRMRYYHSAVVFSVSSSPVSSPFAFFFGPSSFLSLFFLHVSLFFPFPVVRNDGFGRVWIRARAASFTHRAFAPGRDSTHARRILHDSFAGRTGADDGRGGSLLRRKPHDRPGRLWIRILSW